MSKYKVGDKVRVRNDLEINKIYGGFKATSKRLSFSNKIVTIKIFFLVYIMYLVKYME